MKTKGFAASIAAIAAATTATAGVKYWDNPDFKAFDVGDYVQDGLVLHYDGIRNAGADAPHDPNATTWVNLGTGGSDYDMAKKGSPASSYWTGSGFYFDNKTWFVTPNKFDHGSTYEIESLVDAQHASQPNIGYIFFTSTAYPRTNDDGWRYGSIGIRAKGTTYNQAIEGTTYNGTLNLNTDRSSSMGAGTAKRPVLLDESFQYLTALANMTYASIFTGLDEPTGVPGRSGLASGRTELEGESLYFYLGGHNTDGGGETSTGEGLTGTIRNFRYYSVPLSREHRVWNRVVDEARYFHRRGEIPVTNVVVAVSGITGIEDDHFAIDAEGHTFTAPTSRTVEGKRYALGGYTLETWNGSSWVSDGAGTHTGNSVALSDTTGKVRLTWQYSRPAGEGQLAHYDVGDYVTDGLMLFYDGILNQGVGNPHSYDATTWVNIGNGNGSQDWTLSLNHKRKTAGDAGSWGDDGFNFLGYSEFKKEGTLPHPTTHSIQVLVDANEEDQIYQSGSGSQAYIYATAWDYSSLAIRTLGDTPKENSLYWCAGGSSAPNRPYVLHSDGHYDYATAIMDGTAKTLAFTDGVDVPTSGTLADGFYQSESDFPNFNAARIFLGGFNGSADANASLFVGKLKFFRYYPNKALTPAEVAQNRKVDEYRYFGRYVVTNVLVQSTYAYLEGYDKSGPYEVDGSYTFTAPETVTAPNGITYACDGYTVETQDGIGWALVGSYESCSYLYNTSAGTVRLTWKWKATSGLRTAADYSFDDLSPAGLALHYDGLFNQGVGVARSTTSTKWVNLGSRPGMDLNRATASGATAEKIGSWTADGYAFGGNAQFNSAGGQPWATTFSAQALVDASYADNTHVSGNYIAATTWKMFGMQIDGSRKVGRFNAQSDEDYAHRPNYSTATGIDYMTAIHDAATQTAVVFPGTKAPTGGKVTDGYMHFDTFGPVENNQFRLGGWGGGPGGSQNIVGTVKTFRYYDRVLTEEELVRNRNVDAVRYFGELGVTNVLVTVEDGAVGIAPVENGACFVEGQYTFTVTNAPAGIGYKLSASDGNGGWQTLSAFAEGGSYTYTDGTSPACVKLEWRLQKPFTLIIR